MFKCYDCGATFFEPKIVSQSVPYGEGYASYELSQCPNCNGSFGEAFICKDCEQYFFEDELHNGYCIDCVKENLDDPEDLFEFSEQFVDKGCINEFALEMFSGTSGINSILKLLLNFIYHFNPEMLQASKNKFIEKYADELAEYWEKQYGE